MFPVAASAGIVDTLAAFDYQMAKRALNLNAQQSVLHSPKGTAKTMHHNGCKAEMLSLCAEFRGSRCRTRLGFRFLV